VSVPCVFLPNENAQGCLVERARRFREHRPDLRPWEKNPCDNCKPGRDRAEAAGPPKEDETVDQAKVKENVLRVLERKGSMTVSNLKLFAGNKESREDFRAAVDALAGEGKIVTKEGARAGSLHVGLPGAASGSSSKAEKKPEAGKPKTRKAGPVAPSAPGNGGGKPASRPSKAAVNVAGLLNIDEMIGFLEEKRAAIDTAIAGLRALA